jgi:hypothetical protein
MGLAPIRSVPKYGTGGASIHAVYLEINAMKATFLIVCAVMCMLFATGAFGQATLTGSSFTRSYQPVDHPSQATAYSMGSEQNLLGSNGVLVGHGEMPLSEAPLQFHEVPLGDSARVLKQEHEAMKKSRVVWTN